MKAKYVQEIANEKADDGNDYGVKQFKNICEAERKPNWPLVREEQLQSLN